MRSYMKKKTNQANTSVLTADKIIAKTLKRNKKKPGALLKTILTFCFIVPVLGLPIALKNLSNGESAEAGVFTLASVPISAASAKKDLISIPAGVVKANPFLPYRDIGGSTVSDVPNYELVAPPETINENSDAARVMDTIVSGILYDKYSPSAILNIEGNDYLVKKGDVVNNYKVLSIAQDSVTVKLGSNTYKAGIGEILTEGTINYNEVSNLNNKFGGEKR